MFYIKFNFKQKDSDETTPLGESFFIAWSEKQRNLGIARLMDDPNVSNITSQEYEAVGDPLSPVNCFIQFNE